MNGKSSKADALRVEYLDNLKIVYTTCLTGLKKTKAHMVETMLGFLITQSALLGSLYFIENRGIVAILFLVVLLTFWWHRTTMKEVAKHKEAKDQHEAIRKRLESIEREYFALTGTDIRQTFTEAEVHQALNGSRNRFTSSGKRVIWIMAGLGGKNEGCLASSFYSQAGQPASRWKH
jgi:hypothetical protein